MSIIDRGRVIAVASVVVTIAAAPVHAQTWPAKPLRLIVVFAPGGSNDVAARLLAPGLGERLGQQVAVENRPGAGGVVGMEALARSAADGYTLGVGPSGALTINAILGKLSYDPLRDFAPVSMFCDNPIVMVANPGLTGATIRELIARAKTDGTKSLPFGTSGNGTAMHLAGELLRQTTGLPLDHIGYKGGAPAVNDIVGGQIPLGILDLAAARPMIAAGRLRPIGVTGATRSQTAPEIPTLAETGVPGFDVRSWFGILAPAGTPADVVRRLNEAIVAQLRQPDLRDKLLAAGLEPAPGTPQAFADTIRNELARWTAVIKTAGIKLD
jgi:tripartite-type tricarboxylate transporter receptor subunit TctC